ncbi:MAG TPA: AAA family ATPase [Streptosporangiaceae bacterium]
MRLLERTPFLDTLAGYARDARQGSGRLVLVSGESGMGKTALVEAFQQQLADARWLWGACDGLLTPRPLGPLFDIGPQAGGELAQRCRQGATRDELFTAFLAGISGPDRLTVVVIEDLHWADEATADLLSYLGRRLGTVRALILATYRDEELAGDHPMRIVLGNLATQRSTRRMRIPPLSVAAVAELAAAHGADAAELHRVTGGNPFYVTEILAAGWPSIPPTVRDAVSARLARATPGARRAVEAAAIIGGRVNLTLLAAARSGSGPAADLDDCLATGILVADGDGLRFRHELVRMAIEAAIPPHRMAELHARLLTTLEWQDGADPTLLALHAEGAGDADAVRRYAPEAARRCAALGAHREAAAHYERALRFSDHRDQAALAALHEGAAGEYGCLDRWEDNERALRTALALRRELGDILMAGKILSSLATTLWRLCRGAESDQAGAESVAVLETLPPGPELAWAYAYRGAEHVIAGRLAEATEAIGRARSLTSRLGDTAATCYILNVTAHILMAQGQDGRPPLQQALDLALAQDLPDSAGRALAGLHECSVRLSDFGAAERYYIKGLAYSEGLQLGVFEACLLGWHCWVLLAQGQWDEAAQIATRQALGGRSVSPVNRLNPICVLGLIHGRRGDDEGAWKLLDEALTLATRLSEADMAVPVHTARAELHWLAGRPGPAADEATTAQDHPGGPADPWTTAAAAIWLRRLGRDAGLPGGLPEPFALEAAGDWQAAARAWETLGRPYDAALARLFSGNETAMRDAHTTFEKLGARATAAVARRRMRELGLRAVPRGPRRATRSAPAGLTAREQEVLALVSEGLADREISERLFISERTVNHHVSAVLAKIGVSSRTAAAREAARMGLEPAD